MEDYSKNIRFIIINSIKVRWLVALIVLSLPLILKNLDLFYKGTPLLIIGGFIFFYNTIFLLLSKYREKLKDDQIINITCQRIGEAQIILDYITLALVLYYMGAIHTNLFYITIFHIVIGSMILPKIFMYLLTTFSISGFYIISILELNKKIPYYNLYYNPINNNFFHLTYEAAINLIIFIGIVFTITHLVKRIKEKQLKLKIAGEHLEKNLKEIAELEQRKSKFMRYSAHQIRSPLATVISSLNVLTEKLIPLEGERAEKILNGCSARAKSLLSLVNGLLELSRLRDTLKKTAKNDNTNLIEIIEGAVFSLSSMIKESNLTIVREYPNNSQQKITDIFEDQNKFLQQTSAFLPVNIINSNRDLLYQAIYNIIHNSIKYSFKDGTVNISIHQKDNRFFELHIKDHGIGIDKEYLADIFLEFVRSPNTTDHKKEGSGLGLSITQEILNDHNTKIAVVSEIDKGSTFIISFPIAN